ncbi:MAG TPA: hypothetical protein VK800_05365, partial [Steroidobacteraceae bacterium]|nr:hypothetical protein [Steroidobacteraceae bacterium]
MINTVMLGLELTWRRSRRHYTPRLLPQDAAESVSVEEALQARGVRWPAPQVIDVRLQGNVAQDAGQASREIRRVLVRKQLRRDAARAAQLQ